MEQRIKGTTGLMMLIGSPVGHSGSPDMYNFSFRYHKQDYAYMAFDIKEDQVGAALDAMRLFKMRGANVTMPCKMRLRDWWMSFLRQRGLSERSTPSSTRTESWWVILQMEPDLCRI